MMFKLLKQAIRTLLLCTVLLSLFGCNSGYKEKDGKITFNGEAITDKSFIVLNEAFAKNDSTAYFKKYSIPDADIKTFTGLDEHYAKDKNAVFYCDEESEGQNYYLTKHSIIISIKDADPATFRIIGDGYAKDRERAYFKGVGFEVQDVANLTIINDRFLKDKYQVYFDRTPVKGADVNSFRILNNSYAKDTAHAYYYGYPDGLYNGIHEIPCQIASFSLLEYPYSKDRESVYYFYTKINEADPGSFSIVGNDFSKDKNGVYFKTQSLKGADAATFRLIPPNENAPDEFYYAKDKDHVFWNDKMFGEIDMAGFKVLGLGYATDGKYIYYHTTIVKDANPSTFKIYEHGYGDADAEDAKNKYLEGLKVVEE